ncbi:zinc-binding alcohol dehydrogenase [Georgenia sp. TF02-10]|uniref:zinc-dependent alcohol dehydrogenase n=1 Tax=Georgenia sp. TF02-10 TaxID=2917725 RepID=UPI001FA75CD7|nr:zinc-binding alcohol dehydrogenase [Georgenia sp. TF02-10]UNX55206.1 zinc-binding alcohol dehydrogenase [Georgenia sp. TF02-10]
MTSWTAYWTTAPGQGELRGEPARRPGPGEALVRTRRSGISRGTETLVHRGEVPAAVADRMRAPFQEGDLPGPVKYGYLSVGVVEDGPPELRGRRMFCLYPHQDAYVVPVTALTPVPDDVPDDRAVLAGTVETAVNAVWEAAPRLGDRVAVVGAGMVGGAVAALLRRFPLDRLQLLDVNPARAGLARALGVDLVEPADAAGDCDVVVHCSASEDGLARGLDLLGEEGELVEVSWYGTRSPRVPLGGAFHARRLTVRASQVGAVAAARRARRTTGDRLALALRLLADPAFDSFLTGRSPFTALPAAMAQVTADPDALCHVVTYDADAADAAGAAGAGGA